MRNVVDSNDVVWVQQCNYDPPYGDGSDYGVPQNFSHKSALSFRSDSSNTTPNSKGEYYQTTAYQGKWFVDSSHSFSCTGVSAVSPTKPWRTYGWTCLGYYSNGIDHAYGLTGTGSPDLPISVLSRLDSRLRDSAVKGEWNLGQSLAELPETVRFIMDSVRAITSLAKALDLRNFKLARTLAKVLVDGRVPRATAKTQARLISLNRKGQLTATFGYHSRARQGYSVANSLSAANLSVPSFRKLRKATLKHGANAWLMYQFAWLPLLNDIYQACKLIEEGINGPQQFSVYGKIDADPLPPPTPNNSANVGGKYDGWRSKRGCKGRIDFRLANPQYHALEQLGLTNPLTIAWQLLPLSFVVDWLLPVNNFLAGLRQPVGLTFAGGYRTTYSMWSINRDYLPLSIVEYRSGKKPRVEAKSFAFRRDPYISFPIPVPYWKGLGNLTEGKIFSALCLTVQRTLAR